MSPTTLAPLPIDEALDGAVAALRRSPSLVLVAAPGAGKTTRLPPALLRAGLAGGRQLLVLEPRRVAARAAARRIAAEQGWELGREVGYQVRFERRASAATKLLVVTEGVLARRLQGDPFLEDVGAVVFDEFHERRLESDLALAMTRHLQAELRPDLRLVVMSATLDPGPVRRHLGDAPLLEVPARPHPVEIAYDERPDSRALGARAAAAVRRELARQSEGGEGSQPSGDLLVFLPGKGEIEAARRLLAAAGDELGNVDVLALHGDLSSTEQDRALARGERRRVVLATNVAETSVTVEGVTTVIDGGLVRRPRFDAGRGLDRLELVRVSRASADQRAGRAGRERPGRCLRLWTRAEHHGLLAETPPEVRRVDLAPACLELASWGESAARFPWFERPESGSLAAAQRLLVTLGALADNGGITPLGRRLAALPLHPRLGRVLLEGEHLGVARPAAALVAALAEGLRGGDEEAGGIDLFERLRGARGRGDTMRVERQLLDLLEGTAGDPGSPRAARAEAAHPPAAGAVSNSGTAARAASAAAPPALEDRLARSLLAGYPDRLARRDGPERALLVGGTAARLPRGACGDAELLVAVDVAPAGGAHREARIRLATAIDRDSLPAERLTRRVDLRLDGGRGRVAAVERTLWDDLVLAERPVDVPAGAPELLAAAALAAGLPPRADPEVATLLARQRSLAGWMPELGLAPLDDAALAEVVRQAAAGCRSLDEMRRLPWRALLAAHLGPATMALLDRHAPARLAVPSGSEIRLQYEEGRPPVLAARLQELFGLADTPRVAGGRVPVLVHLLAPNGRPQQVTQDLRSFWDNTNPQVRRELARRYPRHAWPEDPWSAPPERRPRRR